MSPEEAFELQLDIALRNVLKVLSNNDQSQLTPQMMAAFGAAKQEWQLEALRAFLTENALEKFQKEIRKELELQ